MGQAVVEDMHLVRRNDLRNTGQATQGGAVQDPVAIPLARGALVQA
jgi:hypothetical protein